MESRSVGLRAMVGRVLGLLGVVLEDEYIEWRKKQEEFLHSESHYWLEWRCMEY